MQAALRNETSKKVSNKQTQVLAYLVFLMHDGELKKNQRINELELSKTLQCSRIPIRQALDILLHHDCIERKTGVGAISLGPTKKKIKQLIKTYGLVHPKNSKTQSLSEQCSERILELLKNKIKQKKWRESELEQELGFSLSSIRNALLNLQSQDLIKKTGKSWALNHLEFEQLRDHFEMRVALETHLLELGFETINRVQIKLLLAKMEKLKKQVKVISESSEGLKQYHQFDLEFHQCIWQAAGCPGMVTQLLKLKDKEKLGDYTGMRDLQHFKNTHTSHRRIANAVIQGNHKLAKSELTKHIRQVYRWHQELQQA